MPHYIAFDPTEARKAAAFVEALAEVEVRFGYRLEIPTAEPVRIDGPDTAFAVARDPGSFKLALALESRP